MLCRKKEEDRKSFSAGILRNHCVWGRNSRCTWFKLQIFFSISPVKSDNLHHSFMNWHSFRISTQTFCPSLATQQWILCFYFRENVLMLQTASKLVFHQCDLGCFLLFLPLFQAWDFSCRGVLPKIFPVNSHLAWVNLNQLVCNQESWFDI